MDDGISPLRLVNIYLTYGLFFFLDFNSVSLPKFSKQRKLISLTLKKPL